MSVPNTRFALASCSIVAGIIFSYSGFTLFAGSTTASVHSKSAVKVEERTNARKDDILVSRTNREMLGDDERMVSNFVAHMMEHRHLSRHMVDDEISRRAMDQYLKRLDPTRAYFLKSDIDEFSKWQTSLDDQLKSGDSTAAFEIYGRFLQRVIERTTDVLSLIDANHDFSIDEEMIIDRDHLKYAADETEARENWRKRIKYALLALRSNQDVTDVDKTLDPKEILRKRYRTSARRIHQMDNEDVVEQYISAITSSFDPHTNYLSRETFEDMKIQMSLELEGIGATLREGEDGYTVIQKLVDGGAAAKQGELKAEDKIVAVAQGTVNASKLDRKLTQKYGTDFHDTIGMVSSDVVAMIRGEAETCVRLSVLSDGDSGLHTIEIIRAKIALEDRAACGDVFEEGRNPDGMPRKIGVLKLPAFYADMGGKTGNGRSTTTDVRRILEDFNDQGVDTLVLDLRANGGGSLDEAVNCTGLFIDRGPVVQIKDPIGNIRVLNDEDRGVAWSKPMIVLTSKFSASASEILAGAVQDYQRGLVVGDTATHGKGTVQHVMDISKMVRNDRNAANEFGALKLTIQQFYRPNGDSTQQRGVVADVVLPSITDHMDVGESDLDYAVKFDNVRRAKYRTYAMTSPECTQSLCRNAESRQSISKDFQKLNRRISQYVEQKNLKTVSLNEAKFLARHRKLNADKEDEQVMERQMAPSRVIDRDFYLDEVLKIASDYTSLFSNQENYHSSISR
jgi:carboxyl-terminal processing protease